MSEDLHLGRKGEFVTLSVRLQPRAARCEICGVSAGALKVRVTSPPVDDRANQQLLDFLAGSLDLHSRQLALLHGLKSRNKTVGVSGLDPAELIRRIHNIL